MKYLIDDIIFLLELNSFATSSGKPPPINRASTFGKDLSLRVLKYLIFTPKDLNFSISSA